MAALNPLLHALYKEHQTYFVIASNLKNQNIEQENYLFSPVKFSHDFFLFLLVASPFACILHQIRRVSKPIKGTFFYCATLRCSKNVDYIYIFKKINSYI